MSIRSTVHAATRLAQGLTLLALPHGGQQIARRNAWASMSADSARARGRRDAARAMARAVELAGGSASDRMARAR